MLSWPIRCHAEGPSRICGERWQRLAKSYRHYLRIAAFRWSCLWPSGPNLLPKRPATSLVSRQRGGEDGNQGTDHGTGTVALLAGSALKGGRVIADWPGVKETDLYEKRDLKATTDLRAVLKGLRDHLRADERALAADVFPGSDAVAPMTGLLA
jgi:hypothetical protein